jgi:hypothetical protein
VLHLAVLALASLDPLDVGQQSQDDLVLVVAAVVDLVVQSAPYPTLEVVAES